MSDSPKFQIREFVKPFSFDGWQGEEILNAAVDFAEHRVAIHAEFAYSYQLEGKTELAEEERQKALWWKNMETLPTRDATVLEFDLEFAAGQTIDALLTRAKVSDDAARTLMFLLSRIARGLNALAANGNQEAAKSLLYSLFGSVDDFNTLAFWKPELFLEQTRGAAALPGLLTLNSEKTDMNKELLKKLEVGSKARFSVYKAGNMPRLKTPSNGWAARLIDHIDQARGLLNAVLNAGTSEGVEFAVELPPWAANVKQLPDFCAATWEAWWEIGWMVVMEATGDHPETEPNLKKIGQAAGEKIPEVGKLGRERKPDSNVLAKIKERLKAAFKELAN